MGADPQMLRLKYYGRADIGFDVGSAILQIECRRKFGKKLAQTLAAIPQFYFPSLLSGEQSTSDLLAAYHSSLLGDARTVVDLTAGLGIDAIHFANYGKQPAPRVTAVEIDPSKAEALAANGAGILSEVACADCRDYAFEADVAFIDPARRGAEGQRVYALADCEPDVAAMLPRLMQMCRRLVVKMSPMLDISSVIESLPGCVRIISLGTTTECKELVAIIEREKEGMSRDMVPIEAVTLSPGGQEEFSFTYAQEKEAANDATIASAQEIREAAYIYEPYPAVMKAGPYSLLAQKYGLAKLHANTHLYVSAEKSEDFPGDCYKVERVIPYESKYIKRFKKEFEAVQVATRNFPVSADALRKKLGVKDGNAYRLYAATTASGPYLILAKLLP